MSDTGIPPSVRRRVRAEVGEGSPTHQRNSWHGGQRGDTDTRESGGLGQDNRATQDKQQQLIDRNKEER